MYNCKQCQNYLKNMKKIKKIVYNYYCKDRLFDYYCTQKVY